MPENNKAALTYSYKSDRYFTNDFRPTNVGFGLSHVLPMIVALLTSDGRTVILESPESHIHPRGQAELGRLIALAAENGAQVFIETHSDHIINGIRVAAKRRDISPEKVNIMFFDKSSANMESHTLVHAIRVDANGSLSHYPDFFLDEWSNQLAELI